MYKNSFNENELINETINDILCNRWEQCEARLKKQKDYSPSLNYCNVIFSLTKACLLFNNSHLDKASADLAYCAKACSKNDSGIFLNIKRVFGFDSVQPSIINLEEELTKEIITADCKLYTAALAVIRKDGPASLIHGILELRRAWKMYSNLQKKFYDALKHQDPRAAHAYGFDPNHISNDYFEINDENNPDLSLNNNSNAQLLDHEFNNLSIEKIKNFLAAVSYGYGITQLCFSFLPPRFMIILNLLGFEGNRQAALTALRFTSQSTDLRAPFADIILLAYSIMGPQIFGYSEIEMYLDMNEIDNLLQKNLKVNPKSCLFLYFKAKYNEIVLRNLAQAFESLHLLNEYSNRNREIQSISWYDTGFLHLMNLNYVNALECFTKFGQHSNWSPSLNTYLRIIVGSCIQNISRDRMKIELKDSLSLSNRRNFLEKFGRKRLEYLYENELNLDLAELLVVELLYLFMKLPYCSTESLKTIYKSLQQKENPSFYSLRCLFEGVINIRLNDERLAEERLKESIRSNENSNQLSISNYVQPYAHTELCSLYIEQKNYDAAIQHLSRAKSFQKFDLRSRLQAHMRCLQRRVDYKVSISRDELITHL